jgi:adenylate cyclase
MITGMNAREDLLLELSRFITEQTLAGAVDVAIVNSVCERLVAGGVPLCRLVIGVDTLHPLVGGRLYTWRRGRGVECDEIDREASLPSAPMWVQSPFHHLLRSGDPLYRFRYPPADGRYPFPILEELAAEGLTDYLASVQRLGEAVKLGEFDCVYSSWGTDAVAGFSDGDVALAAALGPFVAAAMVACTVRQITRTLVDTYLGGDAGQRVLRGAIARGVAERIRAVVWFSDLKGFTSMVDSTDPELVLPLLNDYADPQVAAIHAHGGTVLKFIGDGLLGIFAVGPSAAEAARQALMAADAAFTALAEVSARRSSEGLPATGAYLALHIGDVFYGNIGGADRLDFTVIGPAVNEAARISAMCRPLAQDILVSQAFADVLPDSHTRLLPMGSHRLRGVAQAQVLHAVVPATRRQDGDPSTTAP